MRRGSQGRACVARVTGRISSAQPPDRAGKSGATSDVVAQVVTILPRPAPLTLPTSSALVRRMKTVAPAPAAVSAVSLPNVLTYLRILAVPAVVLCLFLVPGDAGRWWALAVYVAACITDWLDGYLARVWRPAVGAGAHAGPDRRQAAGRHHAADAHLRPHHRHGACGGRRHHPVPRDPGLRPARVPGRAQRQGARDAARQVEDDHADDRARRAAGRARPATRSCRASPGPASSCCGWRRC